MERLIYVKTYWINANIWSSPCINFRKKEDLIIKRC